MRYAVWNNKGGVGKTFLSFVLGTEVANTKGCPVLLVDMCPQANLSEIVLGGNGIGSERLDALIQSRETIGGYFDSRIDAPQKPTGDEASFMHDAHLINNNLPKGVYLVVGDPSLELQAQVISQISGQTLPPESWRNVHLWLRDLIDACVAKLGVDQAVVFVDCNPSFAAYTELAMLSCGRIIVPCSSDGSSARAIDNLGSLIYGANSAAGYGKTGFVGRVAEFSMSLPSVHSIILNRSTQYNQKASKAFLAMFDEIKSRAVKLKQAAPQYFASDGPICLDMPDSHSVAIVCSHLGMPLYKLSQGRYEVHDSTPQVNSEPLERYKTAVASLVGTI